MTVGQVEQRANIAASALRFYEDKGLISAERTPTGRRRYHRDVLRRLAFLKAGQRVGLSLEEIGEALASLPDERTPTVDDWEQFSASWRDRLDERIALLHKLRDELTSCIGCGCLSLETCALSNPGDAAAGLGNGARYLLGNTPADLHDPSKQFRRRR